MPFKMANSPLNNCLFYIVITAFIQLVTSLSRQGDLCLIGETIRGTCRKYEECEGAGQSNQNYLCRTQDGEEPLICCKESRNKSGQLHGNRKKGFVNALMLESLTKDELVDAETIYDVKQVYEGTGSSDRKKHSISISSYNRRQTNEANPNEPNHIRPGYNQHDPNLAASKDHSTEFDSHTYPKPQSSLDKGKHKESQNNRVNRVTSKPAYSQTSTKYNYFMNSGTSEPPKSIHQNAGRPYHSSGSSSEYIADVYETQHRPTVQQTTESNYHYEKTTKRRRRPDQTSRRPDQTSRRPDQTSRRPDQTSRRPDQTSRRPDQTSRRPNVQQTTESNNYYDKPQTTKGSVWQPAPRPLIEDANGYPVPQPPRQTTTSKPTRHPKPTLRRISETKCKEYSEMVTDTVAGLPLTTDPKPVQVNIQKCNYNAQQLIVGGQNTSVGEFPHMAAVGFLDRQRRTIAWNCGGSLISEHFVLTAAHCTTSSLGSPSVVRLGEHNLHRGDDGAHPVDYLVKEVVRHPDYHPPVRYNDIALLRLSRSVAFNVQIRPACLFSRSNVPHDKTIATGWGRIQYAEEQSDVLLKVVLSIINNRKCNDLYQGESKTEVLSKGIVAQQICAGELTGGKDTCQGDSGGPIEITTQENKCIHHVIGVTSFGKRCAQANAPGVYTRVSSYLTWVESVVWPELVLALQTNGSYPRT